MNPVPKNTLTTYEERLDCLKTEIGEYVLNYKNDRTGIGKLIFKNLDFQSKIAFSQVSMECNVRSKKEWFVLNSRDIVLKYIQRGTSFWDYLPEGGWEEGIIVAVKFAGVALTIGASIKSYQHACKIPKDAPTKTRTETDPDTGKSYEITYIDHPEAYSAENWRAGAYLAGGLTSYLFIKGIHDMLDKIDFNVFFSVKEKDIIGEEVNNFVIRNLFPKFNNWKYEKLKMQLSSNPLLPKNSVLERLVCPISKKFMLFPVRDSCSKHGHYFDYRSLRAFQLNPKTTNPFSCPLSTQPNTGLLITKFDKGMFDFIQSLLHGDPYTSYNRVQKRWLALPEYASDEDSELTDFSEDFDPEEVLDLESADLSEEIGSDEYEIKSESDDFSEEAEDLLG